jgi:hypothetical protein
MPNQIHLVIHLGEKLDHILIVLEDEDKGWLFRIVDSQGKILQERTHIESAITAEKQGRDWLKKFLKSP